MLEWPRSYPVNATIYAGENERADHVAINKTITYPVLRKAGCLQFENH